MKKDIHPEYHRITVVMTDGTEFDTYSTVILSWAAPFWPIALSSHSPGASCQKKRPSRPGNTGTPFTCQRTSFPIVAVNSIIC